jgi:CO dehydrogenase/acetyl-CoA synthase beta subunit
MSARLLKKFLKEQELQQQQHHVEDEEEEEEEEAAESPDSENRPAINPFDLLNDDDVDQVLFLSPRSYCTAIN